MDGTAPLSAWKQQFPGQWLALRVTQQNPPGEPEAALLASASSEEALLRTLRDQGTPQALVVFADGTRDREYIILFSDLVWRSA